MKPALERIAEALETLTSDLQHGKPELLRVLSVIAGALKGLEALETLVSILQQAGVLKPPHQVSADEKLPACFERSGDRASEPTASEPTPNHVGRPGGV